MAFISSDGPLASAPRLLECHRRRPDVAAAPAHQRAVRHERDLDGGRARALTNANGHRDPRHRLLPGSISVAAFTGADPPRRARPAAGRGDAARRRSLTTTRAGRWVWGVGSDWDKATARTVGAGQTKVAEYLAPVGDTFWVQRQTAPTAARGDPVTINDTAPTADRWNLAVDRDPAGRCTTRSRRPRPPASRPAR